MDSGKEAANKPQNRVNSDYFCLTRSALINSPSSEQRRGKDATRRCFYVEGSGHCSIKGGQSRRQSYGRRSYSRVHIYRTFSHMLEPLNGKPDMHLLNPISLVYPVLLTFGSRKSTLSCTSSCRLCMADSAPDYTIHAIHRMRACLHRHVLTCKEDLLKGL